MKVHVSYIYDTHAKSFEPGRAKDAQCIVVPHRGADGKRWTFMHCATSGTEHGVIDYPAEFTGQLANIACHAAAELLTLLTGERDGQSH